jgi:serine/threonine protein kinase
MMAVIAFFIVLQGSTDADINAFLNEALIMKDFNHPNVLTLIGITLDKGEFPMVILPFMQNGSLLSFIRNEDNVSVFVKEEMYTLLHEFSFVKDR